MRPLVFVAMPFGRKSDTGAGWDIDFDDIYERAIKPAGDATDVEMVRADEERLGGFIHLPMYERLLLAEIAIVDLTLANPNVLYELGIRHSARPRTTILIYHAHSSLPFDVSPLRALPYILQRGRLSSREAQHLCDKLTDKINLAKRDSETVDSPLFQLMPQVRGIQLPHEATESFRDRAKYINDTRTEIRAAARLLDKERGKQRLRDIAAHIGQGTPSDELLVDLLLGFRDVSAWDDMVGLVQQLPRALKENRTIREQWALALNRRNHPGDRNEAINVLRRLIDQGGANPETCGILGRVYKDLFYEARSKSDKLGARAFLDEAIRWYEQGFEADPRDYYPGINAVTLLLERGHVEDVKRRDALIPVVVFTIARRGGLASDDYWDLATVLELAVHRNDVTMVEQAVRKMVASAPYPWMLRTTLHNVQLLQKALTKNDISADGAVTAIQMLTLMTSEG